MVKCIAANRTLAVVMIFTILFGCVSCLSLISIHQLQGNARVINYVGIVRGATQRLIKKELQGYPDDALIARLNSIVEELQTGAGPNNLVVLPDSVYLDNMRRVGASWAAIKEEIKAVRASRESVRLYELSEDYFILVDQTVSSAEAFSEAQVMHTNKILLAVNGIFILFLIAGLGFYLRTLALRRRAEVLGKMAYFDQLTKLPNRANCDRELAATAEEKPLSDIGIFMFDMNNLKRVNDELGHQHGDRVIADFADILITCAEGFGFVGRYGGDEFLALCREATEEKAAGYLSRINEKVITYNILRLNELEKISFAAGYVIGRADPAGIMPMVAEADRRMYARKRLMKENRNDGTE